MRILVNTVAAKMGGALRHLRGFIGVLGQMGREHEFWVYVDRAVDFRRLPPNTRLFRVSLKRSPLHALYWHQVQVPRLVRKFGMGMVLSPLNFGPLRPPVPQISFQRNSIYFSHYYFERVGPKAQLDARLRRWLTYRTMQASEVVVTPSAAMREMIWAAYPSLSHDKFRVIPHGFDAGEFLASREPLLEHARRVLAETRENQVRLLYATHPAPYKGIEVILHALRIVCDSGVKAQLFLTMEPSDWPQEVAKYLRVVRRLGLEDKIILLGRIPQGAIASVYEACDLFVFPSLCESFGFPMLEAMSLGLPVVAADTAVNREVLGKAALFYPPLDATAAALEILRVVSDQLVARQLSKASLQRVAEVDWSWKRYAREVLALIN